MKRLLLTLFLLVMVGDFSHAMQNNVPATTNVAIDQSTTTSSMPCNQTFEKSIDRHEIKRLSYAIAPCTNTDKPHFVIDLTIHLKKTNKKELTLMLPAQDGNIKDLYREVGIVHLLTPGPTMIDTVYEQAPTIKLKTISGINSNQIHLRYTIVPTTTDYTHIAGNSFYARPLITAHHFYVRGSGIFMVPIFVAEEQRLTPIAIDIMWHPLPENWTFASSFGTDASCQSAKISMQDLAKTLFIGGNFRLIKKCVNNNCVCIAASKQWDNKQLHNYAHVIAKAIGTERDFWHDHETPFYLVVLSPLSKTGAMGGVQLYRTFCLYWGIDQQIDTNLKRLIYHEYFHNWNGGKIKRQQPEEAVYWFSEGFTDYYAYQLALRDGSISFADYVKAYNEVLYHYYTSPVRNLSNEAIVKDFWHNYAIERLPYQRGHILAHNWNASIARQGAQDKSLDDVMHDVLRAATMDNTVFSTELFEKICSKYRQQGVRDDIKKYIDQGDLIEPDPAAFGNRCSLSLVPMPVLDYGFDHFSSIAQNKVCGVVIGSNAYKAGLRDGQQILGYLSRLSGSANLNEPYKLQIKELDSSIKIISFYPSCKKTINVPQYTVKSFCCTENNISLLDL